MPRPRPREQQGTGGIFQSTLRPLPEGGGGPGSTQGLPAPALPLASEKRVLCARPQPREQTLSLSFADKGSSTWLGGQRLLHLVADHRSPVSLPQVVLRGVTVGDCQLR